MNGMARAKRAGDEQVVNLPSGYRVDAAEVRVTRDGNRIVVEEAQDRVDPATGLPMATLLRLLDEGLEGEDEPFDAEDIKRRGRERLAARRAVG